MDGKADNYYFFYRFKMALYTTQNIRRDMTIQDIQGESFSAIDVFSAYMSALKEHWIATVERKTIKLNQNDIKWVLTVPAIWSDKAKQFMRESAEKAGIRKDHLVIALEPEAASIYCQHLPPEKIFGAKEGFSIADLDAKYLVVDIGGGTVDITAHHKVTADHVKELTTASGVDCGGTTVDKEFLNFLQSIVGENVMKTLLKDHTDSYIDLVRELEIKKRYIDGYKHENVNFVVPLPVLDKLCLRFLEKDFSTVVKGYNDKISVPEDKLRFEISVKGDKMRMKKDLMKSFFTAATDNIVKEIKNVLTELPTTNIKAFLLVGGFSECTLVQDAIKEAFQGTQILMPRDDPSLTVVKGAALFGHEPDFITSRITRVAYGRRIRPLFDTLKHNPSKRVDGEDGDRFRDVFEVFMPRNRSVQIDETVLVEYHTIIANQAYVSIAVYYTKKDSTEYVDDDGCENLIDFRFSIPNPSARRRIVDVEFRFCETLLKITTTDRETKEQLIVDICL